MQTILSLFPEDEPYRNLLQQQPCLGADMLQQMISGHVLVNRHDPYMTIVKADTFETDYTKGVKYSFDSSTFLEPVTTESSSNLHSAPMDVGCMLFFMAASSCFSSGFALTAPLLIKAIHKFCVCVCVSVTGAFQLA